MEKGFFPKTWEWLERLYHCDLAAGCRYGAEAGRLLACLLRLFSLMDLGSVEGTSRMLDLESAAADGLISGTLALETAEARPPSILGAC